MKNTLKIAKSSTGYYVGQVFRKDEATLLLVRLIDDFECRQDAQVWIESIKEVVEAMKEG